MNVAAWCFGVEIFVGVVGVAEKKECMVLERINFIESSRFVGPSSTPGKEWNDP